MELADELARKAKDLTADMQDRLKRLPDVADYRAAFELILNARDYLAELPLDAVDSPLWDAFMRADSQRTYRDGYERWIKTTRK